MCQRDLRSTLVTSQQIETYDPETPLYRAVGKAFHLTPKQSVEEFLSGEQEKLNKTQKDLEGRKEYLERRINNNRSNMADITAGTTAAAGGAAM
jgi:chaperonin cofactor prefoldin